MRTFLCLLLLPISLFAQKNNSFNQELIQLATFYQEHHFGTAAPPEETLAALEQIKTPDIVKLVPFVRTAASNYQEDDFLALLVKPDMAILKNLHLMRLISWALKDNPNPTDKDIKEKNKLVKKLSNSELIASYYDMVFTYVGNKCRPFDMSHLNFDLEEYNLANETEKAIFYLKSMDTFGTLIWGYINIAKPPNFDKALEFINKYPTYNNQPYYLYKSFDIQDFKITVDKDKPKVSFKAYQLNKYMNTILYHVIALMQKDTEEEYTHQILDIMSFSIIYEEEYWQYSENPAVFKKIYGKE